MHQSYDQLRRTLAKNLRAAMKRRGWSHRHTADFAGVSLAMLDEVLAGRSAPTLGWLHRVSLALDVPLDDLLRPKDSNPRRRRR